MNIRLNPDKTVVEKINECLKKNRGQYGEFYCPCSIEKTPDTICPCKKFMESDKLGECHCGKYIKTEV